MNPRLSLPVREEYAKGTVIFSRDRKLRGRTTGGFRLCRLESCGGLRFGVRWERDGKMTWPCSKGMDGNKIG